jgi:hypothetical protein
MLTTQRLTGQPTLMGRVDQLVSELRMLARRVGLTSDEELSTIRQAGPPAAGADVDAAGRFGLAVILTLALIAQCSRQPLLLDY